MRNDLLHQWPKSRCRADAKREAGVIRRNQYKRMRAVLPPPKQGHTTDDRRGGGGGGGGYDCSPEHETDPPALPIVRHQCGRYKSYPDKNAVVGYLLTIVVDAGAVL